MSESDLKTDTAYLKGHCLARLPMDEKAVAMLFSRARQAGAKAYADLAMSHERLRAELSGAEAMLRDLDKKVQHGCTDAFCLQCDGDKK